MRLSVCCLTADPGPRVAALLGPLRDLGAEVIVAVDSRLDPDRFGHFGSDGVAPGADRGP